MREGNSGAVRIGECWVQLWLHTDADPALDWWERVHGQIEELIARERLNADTLSSVVITDGGAPNAHQRRRAAKIFDGQQRISVVTSVLNNSVKRGIATALQWVQPRILFFSPSETSSALQYLRLRESWPIIAAKFDELQREIRPVQTLQDAKAAMERFDETELLFSNDSSSERPLRRGLPKAAPSGRG